MAYTEEIYRKILDGYDQTRRMVENERQKSIEAVYEAVPRLREIRNEANAAGAENLRRIYAEPSKKDHYNSLLRSRFAALDAEKLRLLRENGLPEDYDKPHHVCVLCEDTGYIDGRKCRCFEQKLINELYSISNIENVLKKQNFDTFDYKYFSRTKDADGETEYERMRKIHDECVRYCSHFDTEAKSLFFYGGSGTGKTFLSSCIAKYLIDSGKLVVYMRAARLFMMYEDYRFGRSDGMRAVFDRLQDADFIIIDDLGTEIQNKSTLPFFLDLLNERMQCGRRMLISTNLSFKELSRIYSSRFTSRIYEFFTPIHFVCDDIRVKLLKEQNGGKI